jgi:hypothetical protein
VGNSVTGSLPGGGGRPGKALNGVTKGVGDTASDVTGGVGDGVGKLSKGDLVGGVGSTVGGVGKSGLGQTHSVKDEANNLRRQRRRLPWKRHLGRPDR